MPLLDPPDVESRVGPRISRQQLIDLFARLTSKYAGPGAAASDPKGLADPVLGSGLPHSPLPFPGPSESGAPGGGGPSGPPVDPRDPRYGLVNPRTGIGGGWAHAYGTAVPGLGTDVSLSGTRGVQASRNPALDALFKYDVGGQARGLTQDDWVQRPGGWFISGEGDIYGITPDPYD